MSVRFSLITPTLQRESLRKCCESLDSQSFTSWEHIIWVDVEDGAEWVSKLNSPNRLVLMPGVKYSNFGNTPRHLSWGFTAGDYLLHLDDDNYLADDRALERLNIALELAHNPSFAIIPCHRFGQPFLHHPPGVCKTDSANMVIKREIGKWPLRDEYTLDGIFAEQLHSEHGSVPLLIDPVIVVPVQGKGELAQ